MNEDSQAPELPHWPDDWPERRFVDLDNVGDAGLWIAEQLPEPAEVLFGDPEHDRRIAEELADAYIRASEEDYFPLPTEFGASEEEMMEDAVADFLGFIREWRRRAAASNSPDDTARN